MTDAFLPGLDYRPADSGGDGTYDQATDTWTVGALAVGASASFDFVLDTTTPGTFTNAASLAAVTPGRQQPGQRLGVRERRGPTPLADLAVIKGVFPQVAVVGDTVTYQIEVIYRLASDPVPDVYVTDVGPGGITTSTPPPPRAP